MKFALKNIAVFLFFCAALIASVYGVMLPSNSQVTAVGAMQLAPYPDGLSLFQDYRRLYYNFSPFNDYLIDNQGNRSALISIPEIQNKQYTTDITLSRAESIGETVYTYLTNGQPDVTFTTAHLTAQYAAVTAGNKTSISRTIRYNTTQDAQRIGSTLVYHGDDLVFDSQRNIYSFWDSNDVATFTNTYGIPLVPKNELLQMIIPGKEIYVMNPRANFIIVVRAKPNQILRINRDAKLIEVEESVQPGQSFTSSMDIEVIQDPRSIL